MVNATASMDTSDWLPLPPAFHGFGPFLSQVVLGQRLQCANDLAKDDAGREWINLAGDRRQSCFIEQRKSLRYITFEDQAPGLCYPSNGGCSRSALRSDVDRK